MSEYPMSRERWNDTGRYIRALFCREDEHLASIMPRAVAAGLPEIEAGPETGRLLQLLARLTNAKFAIEVGTLAGYSAIWIARGLAKGGQLVSVDVSSTHHAVAGREIAAAGLTDRVVLRQGKGLEVLPAMLRERGTGTADMVFLDALRSEYVALLPTVKQLLRAGGVLVIDNALAAKRWTADPLKPGEPPDEMNVVNEAVAAEADFESTLLPVGNGVIVAVRADADRRSFLAG